MRLDAGAGAVSRPIGAEALPLGGQRVPRALKLTAERTILY